MKNKQVKQMLIDLYADKYKVGKGDIWFEGTQLTIYDAPCGYSEGDEAPLWIHWCEEPYASIKAIEIKK